MSRRVYLLIVVLPALLIVAGAVLWDFRGFVGECAAGGYSDDRYLAYCDSERFGDYEHGAFYFETEPAAVAALRRASVLFLGNSRMLFGFSTDATRRASEELRAGAFYLMGFGFAETYRFPLTLLARLGLTPRVLVVSADDRFFQRAMSPPAQLVTTQKGSRGQYENKILKQSLHARLCAQGSPIRSWCGTFGSAFRSRSSGFWHTDKFRPQVSLPFRAPTDVNANLIEQLMPGAKDFVSRAGVRRECIVLVSTPLPEWSDASVAVIAREIGVSHLSADDLEWATIDGSHLSQESSERWSAQILRKLRPVLARCAA